MGGWGSWEDGRWELGAGSWELGAGRWEPGARSWEMGTASRGLSGVILL